MLRSLRIKSSYWLIMQWRILVYSRFLYAKYHSKLSVFAHNVATWILKSIVCLLNSNHGKTRVHLENWSEQTAALFAPEITPIAVYADSTTDARIVLESIEKSDTGKMIFFSHGTYMVQNISSLLSVLANKTDRSYINVLLFRRQEYPHVEEWWLAYALAMKINLKIIHHDNLLVIDTAKQLLKNNDIVLCAPDYFFGTGESFDESLSNYRKVTALFVRLAKSTKAEMMYVKTCNKADYNRTDSILLPIPRYEPALIEDMFTIERNEFPENWFFSYNHYESIESWNQPDSQSHLEASSN